MFDLANWQNPETLMLNLMNAALGLGVLYLFGSILHRVIVEVLLPRIAHLRAKHEAKHLQARL